MKSQLRFTLILVIIALLVLSACKKKQQPESPQTMAQVSTSPVTGITDLAAIGGGALISEGSAAVTETGICFDTVPEPRIDKGITVKSTGIGNYTCAITGLKPYTKYYVRAYATNDVGTSYGAEVIFRSADNWAKQSIASPGVITNCMKANGNKLWMGTNSGVYYSPDGGDTWQQIGLSTSTVMAIAVQGNTIVAGLSDHSIYKSVDNGASWTKVFTEIAAPFIYDILIKNNNIYACEFNAVYVSSNMGATWVKTKPMEPVQFMRLGYNNNTIYVYGFGTIVCKSADNGTTWSNTSTLFVSDPGGYIYDFDCTDNNLLISTGNGLYYSSDAGVSWNNETDLPPFGSALSVSGNEIFSFVNAAIGGYTSTDKGATWSAVTRKGLATNMNYTDVLICQNSLYIYKSQAAGILYRYRR